MMQSKDAPQQTERQEPIHLDHEMRARVSTRHLQVEPAETTAQVARTGPFDRVLPWVVELRVVGTASTLQVQVEEVMVIGRGDAKAPDAPHINLTAFDGFEKGVSRRHALITVRDKRLWIKDLNSTNGTRLNSSGCRPGEEYRLHHGDELTLGRLKLQVSFSVVPANDTQRVDKAIKDLPRDGAGRRVLVIEDDAHIANVYRLALEYCGYHVTLVTDVTKAMAVCFQGMPDAIVVDMMLPEMNALDVLRYVRKQPTTRPTPMLVIGTSNGYQMSQALGAGADAYLNTPVSVEELVKSVRAAVLR